MTSGRIAVFGSRGQLGQEFCRLLGDQALGIDHQMVDLTDRQRVLDCLVHFAPAAIINTAAYTKVDLAESESALCYAVNGEAVAYLVEGCQKLNCPLVQISTDYVFGADPLRSTPFTEDDLPGPINVYGFSKLEGERNAAKWPCHIILRTCGLYSCFQEGPPRSFVDKMLHLCQNRQRLQIVADQYCTPTYVTHLARAALFLLKHKHYGLFHIVNDGVTNWYEFATELFRQCSIPVTVEPIASQEYPSPARRPRYSALDCSRFHQLNGFSMPEWKQALNECLIARDQSI